MQNIARGSKQNIHLSVYNNGTLIQTDSLPTISIYNADTDVVIASNRSTTLDTESGIYSFYLSEEFTSIVRTLKVVWSYSVSGRAGYEDQYYNVELVYSNVSDIQDFLGLGTKPSELNYNNPEAILSAEKMARTIINGYTGQKFYNYLGSQEQFGTGSDALQLVERMLTIEKVWENDEILIDNTLNPVYNNFGYELEITPTGKAIRIVNQGWDIRYDNQVDVAVLYAGRFRSGSRYKIQGQIGYKYVPEDIKIASMLLVGDILSNDYNWRNKYLKRVNLSEISFEMAKGAFNGTGNVAVDNILDQYRNVNIVII
jgi:hypothetical protein